MEGGMKMSKYEKVKAGGGGSILGNKLNLNYEGSRNCPDGMTWIRGYEKKVGVFGTVYVAGHCRKISDGPEEVRRKVSVL